jgi:hypothetical protein
MCISHWATIKLNLKSLTGDFLDPLKIAVVSPFYKKGDKTSMKNYRPLSLLSDFCKTFEKTMHGSLKHHMHTNNILIVEYYVYYVNAAITSGNYVEPAPKASKSITYSQLFEELKSPV